MEVDFLTAAKGGEVDLSLEGDRVRVRIPAGIESGQKIRLAGKGMQIAVSVKPHPQFERKGSDVYVETPVTIAEAALGATIGVPTIDGTAQVSLPPGTSSGQQLRLRSKGVYHRDGGRGHQYVKVKVVVPKKLDKNPGSF